MAHELWNDFQNMVLGRDDPEVFIPHQAYASLNPRQQDLRGVISFMPRVWGLSSRVHGRILDDRFVQFLFQSEEDLDAVIRGGPWLYNDWFVAIQRWEDIPDFDYLTSIDL